MNLETDRLFLTPYSPCHLLALIESEARFEELFEAPPAEGLRDFLASDGISPDWLAQLRQAESSSPDPWSYGFAIVHRKERLVIGNVGFKGPAGDDGVVEIAYGVVAAFEGRGYATEAARAATAFAFEEAAVRLVRAHTLPTPNASTRVLAKCGYTRTGEVVDPEDGPVWRWELPREAR